MNNQKGGLIQKKKKPLMQPPAPVKKIQEMDFGYSEVVNTEVAPTQELVKEITRVEPAQSRKKLGVGTFVRLPGGDLLHYSCQPTR